MTKSDQALLDKVKTYVITQFEAHSTPAVCFHNLAYTVSVVKDVKQISANLRLLKKDTRILEMAAWFHNIGYLKQTKDFEQHSAKLAGIFLEQQNVSEATIKRISNTIMCSRANHKPTEKLEQVLHDATSFYLSKKSFPVKNELRRKEMEYLIQTEIHPDKWASETIAYMESHRYFTEYGIIELTPKKDGNLLKLKLESPAKEPTHLPMDSQHSKKVTNEHLKAELGSEKGIETLFRIAASNNLRLFTLADNKAHILITVNSIIMSIILSVLIRKLAETPFLTWPTFLLLGTSFLSTVFSILATRPKIDGGTFSQADLERKKVNLIYFGNYHQMKIDEYITGMEGVLTDRVFLYQTLIRDAHWHGIVLGRKYAFLRKAYNVFLFGLGFSIAAFVITFLFHSHLSYFH